MKTRIQDNGHVVIVQLEGVINSACVAALKQNVQDQIRHNQTALIIDMKEVSFISGQGLETLLWIRDLCRRYDIQFRLVELTSHCHTILQLTRLLHEFLLSQNSDDAIKSLA